MLLPKNNCLQIMNSKKKALIRGDFPDFTWCWYGNTRSRSDTSDTSYLPKCSPNVMWCFWSPCQKSYLSKKSSFFTFTAPPSHSHFQFKNTPGYPHMRWSSSRWLLKFPELISEHCLDQRQFPWPDKLLFLIPKISGPDIFSFWTAAGSMTMQITGVTCNLVQRAI